MQLVFSFGAIAILSYGAGLIHKGEQNLALLAEQLNSAMERAAAADAERQSLRASLEAVETALAESRQELNGLIGEQQAALEDLNRDLISTRLRITDNATAASQEWLLAESDSLLRLAQRRLATEGDVGTAIALYASVDDVLQLIDDPAVFAVRQVLAGDLAALRAVPEIEVQSLFLRLEELAARIDDFQVIAGSEEQARLALGTSVRADDSEAIAAGAQDAAEGGFLRTLQQTLDAYLVVRRRDEPIQPLLTPAQEYALKLHLKLQLEQAKIALLRGRQEIFSSALRTVRANAARHLDGSADSKEALLSALEDLSEEPVAARLPEVSNTLLALRRIMPGFHEQPPQIPREALQNDGGLPSELDDQRPRQ